MTFALTRKTLGRLAAHAATPVTDVSTAFSTSQFTAGPNITMSVSSGRIRAAHASAAAASARYWRWSELGSLADVYLQVVWSDVGTALLRAGPMARLAVGGNFPAEAIYGRHPNQSATGTNRALGLFERSASATVQSHVGGNYTPTLPQRMSLWVRGTEADFFAAGPDERLQLTGLALTGANAVGFASFNDTAASSVVTELSEAYAMRSPIVTVHGPPTDTWRVDLLDAADAVLATANAVSGVAEINIDTAEILMPDVVRIEVRRIADDTLLADAEPDERVWGGDVWGWTEAAFSISSAFAAEMLAGAAAAFGVSSEMAVAHVPFVPYADAVPLGFDPKLWRRRQAQSASFSEAPLASLANERLESLAGEELFTL